jgi:adenylate cyclase
VSSGNCWVGGKPSTAGAHDHFQKTVELHDPARHADFANRFGNGPRALAEIVDALTLWVLGRIDEALPLAERAFADAESAAHAPTMAHALLIASWLGLVGRKPEAVASYSQAFADIVFRYDLPAWWAALAIYREQGFVLNLPSLEAALAEAQASAGNTDAAFRRLDDALAELERTEQHWYQAEIHRIRAGILLKREPATTAAAERSLQASIAIAQSQKARSFELRAALSLAKLHRTANRDADAHAVLAPAKSAK